jgi:GMP synthase-like glutamine amidotransferase
MKPVAIFRHAAGDGPGYFSTHLTRRNVPYELIRIDRGDPVPADVRGFAGIGLMGGPMSANDPLPWIPPLSALLENAVAAGVPVIGHCLGGQLLSRSLGGRVTFNPVKEIGWGEVRIADTAAARNWFGDTRAFLSFHWHGETFSIPGGAERIAWSEHCDNQAFAYGPHVGLQCHVEMTPAMIRAWCRSGARELRESASPAVQSPAAMSEDLEARVAGLNAVAGRLYDRWLEGL